MPNLLIDIPDDLSRRVYEMAEAGHKTAEEVVVDALRSSLAPMGSPAAILRVLNAQPRVSVSDVEALEMAIASGRLPVSRLDPFSDRSTS